MGVEGELLRRIQAALAGADLEVEALVEETWGTARSEVRTVLQRAFQQEMLERVAHVLEDGLEPQPQPQPHPAGDPPPPVPDADPRPSEQAPPPTPEAGSRPSPPEPRAGAPATYLYGITRPSVTLDDDLPSIGQGPVRAIDQAGLRAVVCDADADALACLAELGTDELEQLADAANAHEEVLSRVAAQEPVLPLRLGTVVHDDEVVRALLGSNVDVLRAELERFEGHAEWAVVVRVVDDEAAHDRTPTEADTGGDYLRRRRAELDDRERRREARDRVASDLHHRLATFADTAEIVERRPLEQVPPTLHGVYLLAFESIGPFEAAVEEARAEYPEAIIEATGPWPPYHFTTVGLSLDQPEMP